jgi:ankyrin repeat protein
MSDALPLPPRPSLEQYKKLAKDCRFACRSSDPGAVHEWAARWAGKIARLRGIEITPQVRREIDREANRIAHRWHQVKTTNERPARCTLADAQFFIAREHGFASWPKFAGHVAALARANSPESSFEAAADAIVSGEVETLRKLLHDDPELARARSTREHRSTLLHYVSANGVEDFRQKTPKNIVGITEILLDSGADVNAESDAYGGGSTTLGLVATSIHPQRAGVQLALLQTLLDRGARIEQPSAAGNGQSIIKGCIANGQPRAAEFFATLGVPLDLEGAAALGRLDLVASYFDENGARRPHATRKQMESAFLYACSYGRKEVVELLLEKGVDASLHNAGGQTGLHWAAYGAHVDVVELLLRAGSPVDVKDKNYRGTPLDAALHAWLNSPDTAERERCYEVIVRLARAGARLDPRQWVDPHEDRPGVLEQIRSDPRMLVALRGESVPQ